MYSKDSKQRICYEPITFKWQWFQLNALASYLAINKPLKDAIKK